jgi:glucokinase
VNPWFAGIDLGGTSIGGAAATRGGLILAEETVATHSHEGPTAVLARIGDLVERLAGRCGGPPQAIGVGVPGLVDLASGATRFLPNLPTQWPDVPVRATLERRFGVPVGVLNDCRTATLGELLFGHGQTVRTFALFALGTGVGGGVVIDGKLRLGPLGAAGELGHQTIVPGGPRCGCGNLGCLESLASGPAIAAEGVRLVLSGRAPGLRTLVEGDANRISPRTIAEAAAAGDADSRGVIERTAEYLATAAANVVTILHPEMIVVAGGVAEMGEPLLEPVRRGIRERVRMFPSDDVRVERSLLGDDAGVRGAVALAIQTLGSI